jgi:hypothetical protein
MEEEEALRQLARAILDLPVKGGDKKSSTTAAQTLLDECLSAKVELRLRKKSGTASTLGVERGLKQIASRSRTLLKLLKNADRNIFEGWVHAARAEEAGWPAPGLDDTQLGESSLPLELHRAQIPDRRVPSL